jgi:hypothetical protein
MLSVPYMIFPLPLKAYGMDFRPVGFARWAACLWIPNSLTFLTSFPKPALMPDLHFKTLLPKPALKRHSLLFIILLLCCKLQSQTHDSNFQRAIDSIVKKC